MIDVKKLVIGFLVLAGAASFSALLITHFGGKFSSDQAAAADASLTATGGDPASNNTLSGNAFLPQATDQITPTDLVNSGQISSSTTAIGNDPTNLTNIFASNYLNGLVVANPTGLQTDTSGNVSLTPPSNNTVISQFEASSTVTQLQIPDWDMEAAEIPITSTQSSTSTLTSYNGAVQSIVNQDFVQTNLESMLSNNADPSAATFAQQKVQSALKDIAGIKTPQSALAIQKSFITLLVYEKNMLALAANASNDPDPVKTSVIFQGEENKYNVAIQNFTNSLASDPELQVSFGGPAQNQNKVVAFVNGLMGIKTANAQWITFDPTTFAQMILDYAKNILLQVLKNIIVSLVQNKVLGWIRGSGTPRFIQNWATTLVNSYEQSALNALDSQMSCISSAPFAKQLQITLRATYKPDNNVCAVQFQSQLSNNLTQFYNKFSSGGWVTFGATLQPDNNYYGALFFTAQTAGNAAQTGQQAAQAKSVANQGFTGSQTCDDGSDPINGNHYECPDGSEPSGGFCDDPDGGFGTEPTLVPNDGVCADGTDPEINSPGAATGQVFNSAVDSGPKLITAANDITGLLNAALSSLLNSLATEAITATTGAFNSVINGGGGSKPGGVNITTTNNGSSTTITATTPITCSTAGNILSSDATNIALSPNSFTFTAAGGEGIDGDGNTTDPQFVWSAPSGTPSSGVGPSLSVSYNATGTFYATVTDLKSGNTQTCTANVETLGGE